MVMKFDTKPVKVDQFGHQQGGGQFVQNEINQANIQQANRVLSHAVTGRASVSGGTVRVSEFNATPLFVDVDVATDTIGSTKATLDASLALVNDALAAVFVDANLVLVALGLVGATYVGGGTAAATIAVITDSGTALVTSAPAADMNTIRIAMDTNMHVAGALVNKCARALRHRSLDIETNPYRQPPPDVYGQGSIGFNPPDGGVGPALVPTPQPTVSTAGTGRAFGTDSPFVTTTPVIGEDSGTHVSPGVTKVALDAALSNWTDNIETMAARLRVYTNDIDALTDSSNGTAQADRTLDLCTPDAVNGFPADIADVGTDLSQEADTDASLVEVRDAVQELADQAVQLAKAIAVGGAFTYDGGGSGITGTIAAIDVTGTAAATGSQKADMDTWALEADQAFDMIAVLVNRIAEEVDVVPVSRAVVALGTTSSNNTDGNPVNRDVTDVFATDGALDPFPGVAIPVTAGDADPGQLVADVEDALVRAASNVALLASVLNECRLALAAPLVKLI